MREAFATEPYSRQKSLSIINRLLKLQGKNYQIGYLTGRHTQVHRRTGTMAADDKGLYSQPFHVERDDFKLDPFNKQGGLGKMWLLFGEETDAIIGLNEKLVA